MSPIDFVFVPKPVFLPCQSARKMLTFVLKWGGGGRGRQSKGRSNKTVEEGEMYLCPKQIKTAASCFKGSTKASTNSINTSYSQLFYFTRHLGSKSFTLKVSLLNILFVRN